MAALSVVSSGDHGAHGADGAPGGRAQAGDAGVSGWNGASAMPASITLGFDPEAVVGGGADRAVRDGRATGGGGGGGGGVGGAMTGVAYIRDNASGTGAIRVRQIVATELGDSRLTIAARGGNGGHGGT